MSGQPVRWGVLGTARITAKVAPGIVDSQEGELCAVASRSMEKAKAWAQQYGVAKTFDSYEALLDDPEIDAVYIPLPNSMHYEWTIKAAERKKHVLCEKPLALTAQQGREMADACRENGVQLMDGVMWYHHPRCMQMKEAVRSGKLGEHRKMTSAFSFCWHEIPENEFRTQREHGGGSLFDLGWYCVGATLQFFEGLPNRVWGAAKYRDEIDMSFQAVMWYEDGRVSSFDSAFDTGMRKWLEVAGTHGSLVCDDFVLPWPRDEFRFWVHDEEGVSETHTTPPTNQIVHMIDDFNTMVKSGQWHPEWPELSLKTQKICDALDQAARTERIVELDW